MAIEVLPITDTMKMQSMRTKEIVQRHNKIELLRPDYIYVFYRMQCFNDYVKYLRPMKIDRIK